MFGSRFPGRSPFQSYLFLFNADGGAGGGATPPAPANNPVVPPVVNPTNNPDNKLAELLQSVLQSQRVGGNSEEALRVLAGRVLAEETRAKAAEANAAKPEDVQALKTLNETLQKHGLKLEDLPKRLELAATLEGEKAQQVKLKSLTDAVSAEGFDAEAIASLSGALDDEYFTRDVSENGKTVKRGFVKFKNESGAEVEKPVAERITERWPKLADKLKTAQSASTQQTKITPFPRTAAPGAGNNESALQRIKREAEERKAKQQEKDSGDVAARLRNAGIS